MLAGTAHDYCHATGSDADMSAVDIPAQRLKPSSVRLSVKRLVGYERAWPLHAYVVTRPRLFCSLVRLLGRGDGGMVTPHTGLVIAGMGGCSNTYAADNIKQHQPGMHVASHWHIPALAVEAARLNIPCLTLIRQPLDAITSLASRGAVELSERGMKWALKDYAFFYETVLPYRGQFIAAHFDEVTSNYPATIEKLNRRFDTDFTVPDTDSIAEQTLVQKNRWRNENRLYTREEVRRQLLAPGLEDLRAGAEKAYTEFCKLTGISF